MKIANTQEIENAQKILAELETAFYDIPFENSDFQNKAFVLAGQYTPARAYRALGLKLSTKLRAINELKFSRQREEVDLAEKRAIINSFWKTKYDKRRAQIDIDQTLSNVNYTNKLLNDAIHELNVLYAEFKKFPRYTREQFEAEEHKHFETRLNTQIEASIKYGGAAGSVESLHHMGLSNTFDNILETVKHELSITHTK
jgi:hypothetical protein